jgi:hypothetical protein
MASGLTLIGVLACLLAFVGSVGASPPQTGRVSEELLEKAQRLGAVRVNVQLRVDVGADEQVVEATKAAVLSEIGGARYRVLRKLRGLPLIGMEASYDALLRLDASAGVLRVEEDALARPQGG